MGLGGGLLLGMVTFVRDMGGRIGRNAMGLKGSFEFCVRVNDCVYVMYFVGMVG